MSVFYERNWVLSGFGIMNYGLVMLGVKGSIDLKIENIKYKILG